MDDLLEQFGELVFDIARDVQNDGYFSGSQELGEAYQTFLHDVLPLEAYLNLSLRSEFSRILGFSLETIPARISAAIARITLFDKLGRTG
jgi:hypothetical protein